MLFRSIRREVTCEAAGHPRARLDLLLSDGPTEETLVEVKNVTLLEGETLRFPDAESLRALKHLDVLNAALDRGSRAALIFALNRPEGKRFAPAEGIHPKYAERLREVSGRGVEIYALRIVHTPTGMSGNELVPIELNG